MKSWQEMLSGSVLKSQRWVGGVNLQKLGTAGVSGIGVLLFCAAFYLSAIAPAREQLADMELRVEEHGNNQVARKLRSAHGTIESQLAEFYSQFPSSSEVPTILEKIYTMAAGEGIQLPKADYRMINESSGKLERYEVVIPLKATYPQVRRFSASILNGLPMSSLDELTFEGLSADASGQLDVRLRLTLFVRPASPIKQGDTIVQ